MEEIKCVSIVSDLVTIENPFDQSYKLGNLFTKRGWYVISRLSMFKSATCCCTAINSCLCIDHALGLDKKYELYTIY